MKTILRRLKALSLPLFSVLTAPLMLAQTTPSENSSGAISVDRSVHYAQTGDGQITAQQTPFNFTFHVRGGSETLKTNWGPKFYKPGSAGVVQSGSSSATNTGTLNFPDAPNNGSDFMFVHEFDTDSAMEAFYPIAPTDGGQYGVKFLGSNPPAASFTDGLVFATGTTYPAAVPQVTSVDNDAQWVGGKLRINPSGLTTLTFNTFSEYSSTTYGSMIAVGIYDAATGTVVDGASKTSYYLPVGDSTENPDPIVQPAITEISLDSSWLVPGRTYTLELQYTIIAGRPEEATLAGVEFQGVSSYRRVTTVSLVVGSTSSSDFDGDGLADIVWRHQASSLIASWTSTDGYRALGQEDASWEVIGFGDYDGDGKADLLWRHVPSSLIVSWTSTDGYRAFSTEDATWKVIGSGDYDGDGKADLLWRHVPTSLIVSWTSTDGYRPFSTEDATWKVIGSGDYDGDGKADLLWRHVPSSLIVSWTSTGGYRTLGQEDANWEVIGSGDYDGDGVADLLWRHIPSSLIVSWTSTDGYRAFSSEDADWKVVRW